MGVFFGPGVEPSCLRTVGIDDKTCAEIGGVNASVVANSVVGTRLTPSTEDMSGGKMLESMGLLNNNQRNM